MKYWLSLVMIGMLATPTLAHMPEELLSCPIFSEIRPTHTPKRLKEMMAQQGLLAEIYDVTGDGRPDVGVYSATLGGYDLDGSVMHSSDAIFYELDIDGDEFPDVLYIDQYGLATCDALVFYHDPQHGATRGGIVNWQETRDDLLYDGHALEEPTR